MNEEIEYLADGKDFFTYVKEAIGQTPLEVKLKKLSENAIIPKYANDGDVGMDLTAISMEYDAEKDMYVYHTGLAFETDKHYGIFLFPRSSNRRTDAYLCNHVGIADSAIYRGEIILCFKNRTSLEVRAEMERTRILLNSVGDQLQTIGEHKTDFKTIWETATSVSKIYASKIYQDPLKYAPYKVGERIVQMVVLPYPSVNISERNELSETERGANAFGSSGK